MSSSQERTNENIAGSFYGLGIAPALLEILARFRFKAPTPIQTQAIPIAIQGKDIVGIAQTGTGKTLAFGVPMIQRLAQTKGQGLVVLPTRELALQVDEMLRKLGNSLGLRSAVLIGGTPIRPQVQALFKKPHLIIATPGRLLDHLQQKNIRLDRVSVLVIDEADRMLDMGFLPQIKRILQAVPKNRQTMLFSATIPPEVMKIAGDYMKLPVNVEVAPSGTTIENVIQEIYIVEKAAKLRLLSVLLKEHRGPTLIFTRTKFGARRIARDLRAFGESAAEIHSNRSLAQRREALDGFRFGRYRVLVATDIASRGIDVKEIETVINYDLPSRAEDYVHRIGRTGRAGRGGHAISFALPNERNEVQSIERLIRKTIPVSSPPDRFSKELGLRLQFNPPRSVNYPGRNRRRYRL
ncbi:MAG: DEAD/DEAH box helicase [Candidatus Nealsonbacteria bacterium]|nr:DEAD/DEAH box helicase [Candidatus Nealsonbacteria bacterium]